MHDAKTTLSHDNAGPAKVNDIGEFAWKAWNGSGRHVSEVALMQSGFLCGFVWRTAKDKWAFGVAQKVPIAEYGTLSEAQHALLAQVQSFAALTPSSPNAYPVRKMLHKAVSKALHDNQFLDGWPEMVDPVVDAVLACLPTFVSDGSAKP